MGGAYDSDCEPPSYESIPFAPEVSIQAQSLSRWLTLFFLRLQAAYHISDAAITCILKFIAAFFIFLSNISSQCVDLAKVFPNLSTWPNINLQARSTLFVMSSVKNASTFIYFKIVSRGQEAVDKVKFAALESILIIHIVVRGVHAMVAC